MCLSVKSAKSAVKISFNSSLDYRRPAAVSVPCACHFGLWAKPAPSKTKVEENGTAAIQSGVEPPHFQAPIPFCHQQRGHFIFPRRVLHISALLSAINFWFFRIRRLISTCCRRWMTSCYCRTPLRSPPKSSVPTRIETFFSRAPLWTQAVVVCYHEGHD